MHERKTGEHEECLQRLEVKSSNNITHHRRGYSRGVIFRSDILVLVSWQ